MNLVIETRVLERQHAALLGHIASGGEMGRAHEFAAAVPRFIAVGDLASARVHLERAEQELREARAPRPMPPIAPIQLALDRTLGITSEAYAVAAADFLLAGVPAAIREPLRILAQAVATGEVNAEVVLARHALAPIMALSDEDRAVFPVPVVAPLPAFVSCDSSWAAELAKDIGVGTRDLGNRVAAAHAESVRRGRWLGVFWLEQLHRLIAANASNGQPEAVEAVAVTRVLGVWRSADVATPLPRRASR